MKKWNLIIDVAKCEDCNNCFLACKDEHVDNTWPGYAGAQPRHGHRWINILRKERGQFPLIDVAYRPTPCMHCDNAPCIAQAQNGSVYKRDDGIVIIDAEKAKDQKGILDACPYGAVWWNEEKKLPQKCTFCAHLLDDGWKEPRCVQACPSGALRVLSTEESEMKKHMESENLEVLFPQYNTKPRVYYKNLYRFHRCFIGGSVSVDTDGTVDCAEGARVTLAKDNETVAETVTDVFGDFKFDNLEESSGRYSIDVVFQSLERKTMEIDLKASINVGDILFRQK